MTTTRKIERIPKDEVINDDLRRLVKSMKTVLARKYKDPEVRHRVASKIMQEVRGAA